MILTKDIATTKLGSADKKNHAHTHTHKHIHTCIHTHTFTSCLFKKVNYILPSFKLLKSKPVKWKP